jgi:uncharacterized protein (DUF433 family)
VRDRTSNLVNTGIYSVSEAALLTRIPGAKIRRWIRGYTFHRGQSVRHSDAVWETDIKPLDDKLALSFRDLLELRFVDAFIKVGVSWKTMRRAHANAQEELRTTHPFCSQRIATDGKNILLRQAKEDSDAALLNLVTNQREFSRIVHDFLKELEFSGDEIVWWPLGKSRQIIVDPRRNFGQPTVVKSGVPAQILARSVRANSSEELVARWYEVQPEEIRDALAFEESLAKAA